MPARCGNWLSVSFTVVAFLQLRYEKQVEEQARKKAEEERLARATRALAEAATPVPKPADQNEWGWQPAEGGLRMRLSGSKVHTDAMGVYVASVRTTPVSYPYPYPLACTCYYPAPPWCCCWRWVPHHACVLMVCAVRVPRVCRVPCADGPVRHADSVPQRQVRPLLPQENVARRLPYVHVSPHPPPRARARTRA